ncbi:succinate dehydrogenase, cytochrome b556 subunit [bacterium]|nr:succinate dehydrogenase, cytochrome b556 subunit [bacterium]
MVDQKKYCNRLGIIGWLGGGHWGPERLFYLLHRFTGIGILFYFLLHVFVTTSRAFGQAKWDSIMAGFHSPIFKIGEFFVFAAFAFHAFNGIRLVLIELGFGVGKAEDPVYPYRTSINKQKPLLVIMMVLALILIFAGSYDFIRFTH